MFFITNRVLNEGNISKVGRSVTFDLDDNNVLQSLFYCERKSKGKYVELGSEGFLEKLKGSKAKHIVLFVHGFANLPEDSAFQNAETLQALFDSQKKNFVEVVPLIWPCKSNEFDVSPRTVDHYFTDQLAADASGYAFSRALERLRVWQDQAFQTVAATRDKSGICLKRLHVLAHSMGNRVYRQTMKIWVGEHLRQSPPLLFRNSFLVAADIVNESLQRGNEAEAIVQGSGNVIAYFAADDMAMRASKGANLLNNVASRRLGHTGPENWSVTPANVSAVNCNEFCSLYDDPFGHNYFLRDPKGNAGRVFMHIHDVILKGVVGGKREDEPRLISQP